jgi:uncharacterized radical SAM superfamily protein
MSKPSAEEIWSMRETQIQTLLESGFLRPKNKEIRFYAPSFTYYKTKHFCPSTTNFPTISITGNTCSLNCKHCGGIVLETMHPARTPEELFLLGSKLTEKGATGVLISGGCLPDGSVPLNEFVPVFKKFKRELGLTVFVHTGLIKPKLASALKAAGVDAALIDVIGSSETIKEIYNLSINAQDYADSLKALNEAELPFVPHVIVGLNEGKLDGEFSALQIIAHVKPSAIVIIAFMPIYGTAMANTIPPTPLDIAKVTAVARTIFPKTPLLLGCMRPKDKTRGETDLLALKAGVDGIAFPSDTAIKYAKDNGFSAVFSSYCCAQMFLDLKK